MDCWMLTICLSQNVKFGHCSVYFPVIISYYRGFYLNQKQNRSVFCVCFSLDCPHPERTVSGNWQLFSLSVYDPGTNRSIHCFVWLLNSASCYFWVTNLYWREMGIYLIDLCTIMLLWILSNKCPTYPSIKLIFIGMMSFFSLSDKRSVVDFEQNYKLFFHISL